MWVFGQIVCGGRSSSASSVHSIFRFVCPDTYNPLNISIIYYLTLFSFTFHCQRNDPRDCHLVIAADTVWLKELISPFVNTVVELLKSDSCKVRRYSETH